MEWKFRLGDRVVFNTVDTELSRFNGLTFEVVRKLREDEADLCETGPMYEMRLVSKVTAFEDEMKLVEE